MALVPGLAERFLIVDRSAEIQRILAEVRTRLTDRETLAEVEPLIGSVEEYVPRPGLVAGPVARPHRGKPYFRLPGSS